MTKSTGGRARIEVLGNIGPNWFASVMGTGIVANAGATLPMHVPGLRGFAQIIWVVAAVLLLVLVAVVGGHWLRHPTVARSHARNRSSSASGTGGASRCVERAWPISRHARRSETPNRSINMPATRRRWFGVTIFPRRSP